MWNTSKDIIIIIIYATKQEKNTKLLKKQKPNEQKIRPKWKRRTRGKMTLESDDIICHNCKYVCFIYELVAVFLQRITSTFVAFNFTTQSDTICYVLHAWFVIFSSRTIQIHASFSLLRFGVFVLFCVPLFFSLNHLRNRSIKQRLPLQSNDCVFLKLKHHWNECFSFIFNSFAPRSDFGAFSLASFVDFIRYRNRLISIQVST